MKTLRKPKQLGHWLKLLGFTKVNKKQNFYKGKDRCVVVDSTTDLLRIGITEAHNGEPMEALRLDKIIPLKAKDIKNFNAFESKVLKEL